LSLLITSGAISLMQHLSDNKVQQKKQYTHISVYMLCEYYCAWNQFGKAYL